MFFVVLSKYRAELGALLFFVISVIVALLSTTTFDTGDSITHYLISRNAFTHPELLLHHWGKPLFTLLSMPFAQFGFKGIEVYNCLVSALCAYLAFLSSKKMQFRYAWMVYPFMLFAPKFFLGQFSGLTEPTFALCLIAGFYFMLDDKPVLALLIISLSPFVRTEGFIILIIYGIYLLLDKRWSLIPWLLVGLILYSVIGSFYYHDLLWVFHENPYAGGKNNYGHGTLDHYAVQLMYVLGVPFYILLVLAFVFFVVNVVRGKYRLGDSFSLKSFILLYGCLLGFIVSHTLFWWLGIFNSFGMVRIMICIVPLAAVVAVQALHYLGDGIASIFPQHMKSTSLLVFYSVVGIYVSVFPFTSNPAAFDLEKDFSASQEQFAVKRILVKHTELLSKADAVYFSHPLIAMELIGKVDYEKQKGIPLAAELHNMTNGSVVLCDNWFAVMESNINDSLFSDSNRYQYIDKDSSGAYKIKLYLRR
jgi:hypothetical protein